METRYRTEPDSSCERANAAAAQGCAGVLWVVLVLGIVCGGCASGPISAPGTRADWTDERAAGDRDDVDAAVEVGVESVETAVLEAFGEPGGRRVYRLRTVDGRDGELVVEPGENDTVVLRARIGPFGDTGREAELLSAVRARLGALRGVGWAPVE